MTNQYGWRECRTACNQVLPLNDRPPADNSRNDALGEQFPQRASSGCSSFLSTGLAFIVSYSELLRQADAILLSSGKRDIGPNISGLK